jgi:hypothetical protein
MVEIDSMGMHYNEPFGMRYSGMTKGQAFDIHVADLERAARGEEDKVFDGDLFGL